MPRRSGHGLSSSGSARLAALTLLALVGGCQPDSGDNGCQLTTTVVLPESPLTLLSDARLDRVGDGFVLIGRDGATVRWASLTDAGVLGTEHSVTLPTAASSPRFAVAGTTAPATRVLVAYLTPAVANAEQSELHVIAAAADGTDPGQPGPALVTFGGGPSAGPAMIEMGSSRQGMVAGLAWLDRQAMVIRFVTVDGAGQLLGDPTPSDPATSFACLDFTQGKGDLTFTYERTIEGTTPAVPSVFIADALEDGGGGIDKILRLTVAQTTESLTCSIATPTRAGYALAWQDYSGSWLSVYSEMIQRVMSYPFASATDFGGPDLQPPLRGLAQFGNDYGVLLAKPHAVELWRLNGFGDRQPGALVFPSLVGYLGEISTVQAGSALSVTYADYTDSDRTAGRRVFVKAACY